MLLLRAHLFDRALVPVPLLGEVLYEGKVEVELLFCHAFISVLSLSDLIFLLSLHLQLKLPPSFIFCLLSLNIPLVFLGGLPLKIFVDLEVVLLFHSFLVSLLLQGHPESFLLHL